MPQHSLLPDQPRDMGLRLTITDHALELEDAMTVGVALRVLDGDWSSFSNLHLPGHGRDFLATAVSDITHAWWFEDRRAILREIQRNQREARTHNRRYYRAQ